MEIENTIKSTEEQAVAAWISYLNQLRLDRLFESLQSIGKEQSENLAKQAQNLSNAMESLDKAAAEIKDLININRGGERGIGGFISEPSQVGIGNARLQIRGENAAYRWTNDNGPVDITKEIAENGLKTVEKIQMKFEKNKLSLDAILRFNQDNPDFLKDGGKFMISKDFYEKIQKYLDMPQEEANNLPTSNLREWEYVNEFFKDRKIPLDRIEPAEVTYKEVQKGAIKRTISNERKNIKEINEEQNEKINKDAEEKSGKAYSKSKPSLKEGVKSAAVSSVVEGSTAFCTAVIKKRKSGKKLRDFTEDDWKEIGGESALGTFKGGVRGASIYALTNYTATPAAVASSLTTAAFGVAEQVNKFRNGKITATELVDNSEMLCLDTTVSAFSSFVGQITIPVPILGAVIGNAVGTMMYQFAKDSFNEKEQKILGAYINEAEKLGSTLDAEYTKYVETLNDGFVNYIALVQNAFSPDYEKAFDGSIELALSLGVDKSEILTSKQEVDDYFLK